VLVIQPRGDLSGSHTVSIGRKNPPDDDCLVLNDDETARFFGIGAKP
jgi:hypothetical protein